MLTFKDRNKPFNLDGDLLKTMTNYDFNASFSNPQHQKLNYGFGKERNFKIKQTGRKSNRDISLKKLFKSPAVMAPATSVIF